MLTIAYIRVSTEDQVDYSPDAQRNRCLQHAINNDLGAVTFLSDDGLSGKDLKRPAMAELIALTEADQVANVIVWRLDRLSRDSADLSRLIKLFETHCVGVHSVNEGRVDVGSASGRMQAGIHGVLAQYYREGLVENVKLGNHQAIAVRGEWLNRAPTGYAMINGRLQPDELAPLVTRVFQLRASGKSYPQIEAATGLKYSTIRHMCSNRVYLGETRIKNDWFQAYINRWSTATCSRLPTLRTPGAGESAAILLPAAWSARAVAGDSASKRTRTVLASSAASTEGRVVTSRAAPPRACTGPLDSRSMCWPMTNTCRRRSGISYTRGRPARTAVPSRSGAVVKLHQKRQKLLDLYYADKITPTAFNEEEARLTGQIRALEDEAQEHLKLAEQRRVLADRFEQVAAMLREMDTEAIWEEATASEQRVLFDQIIEAIIVHPDRLQVSINGAPPLTVNLEEVGLRKVQQPPERAAGTGIVVSEGGLEPPRTYVH
ncbi:MAG: hypothetical protein RL238_3291 [Actinomycetota bacterium]